MQSVPAGGQARPEVAATSSVLLAGTLASVGCFVVGFLLGLARAGESAGAGSLVQLPGALLSAEPWAWSLLGVLVLLLTPAAGLVATFLELRAEQPRTALLALAVLAVLALASGLALLG